MATTYEMIENAPANVSDVANLADWGQNEIQPTTFALFLDIIGYSQDEYGAPLADYSVINRLGFVEREKLRDALSQYLASPDHVLDFIRELMAADDD